MIQMRYYKEFHTPEETERLSGFIIEVIDSKEFH